MGSVSKYKYAVWSLLFVLVLGVTYFALLPSIFGAKHLVLDLPSPHGERWTPPEKSSVTWSDAPGAIWITRQSAQISGTLKREVVFTTFAGLLAEKGWSSWNECSFEPENTLMPDAGRFIRGYDYHLFGDRKQGEPDCLYPGPLIVLHVFRQAPGGDWTVSVVTENPSMMEALSRSHPW